ncbi:MAG: DUF134 domain-containing protein [Patescibacteria group bacterium]|nr:DUF134 domain-containing protein [Patescibacteria group bacterium]
MIRPIKPRQVRFDPEIVYFKPRGVPLSSLEEVRLTFDELEAIRLTQKEDKNQITAAKLMKVSQPTLARILSSAYKKIADALICGKAIRVKGGEIVMPRPRRGLGRVAGGRGRMGGPLAAGPGGVCICTNTSCGYEQAHKIATPCNQLKCPKCGLPMARK